MAMCLNRITMNIIKDKCIGNRNLECLGISKDYQDYCRMFCGDNKLTEEEYMFVKTWSNKKPRAKTKEVK